MMNGLSSTIARRSIFITAVILGVLIRVWLWWVIPATQFAGDEKSYLQDGWTLAKTGVQTYFWPPGIVWLVAMLQKVGFDENVKLYRLLWLVLDLGVAALVWKLAKKAGARPGFCAGFYLLYIPAISFAIFVTSETPTVLDLLAGMALITADTFLAAGFLIALVVLARTNLAGLLGTLPLVIQPRRKAAAFAAVAILPVLAWPFWVQSHSGIFTLSTNSDLNIYAGNVDFQEELNIFHPWSTKEQMAYRQRLMRGEDMQKNLTREEMRQEGIKSVKENKLLFMRRVVNRFAKLFSPRVAQMRLVGQERMMSAKQVFSPVPFFLLASTNLQWLLVAVFGTAGLLVMKTLRPLFLAVIAGSIIFCLVAISQPRYSFPFEPLLIIAAGFFLSDWRAKWKELNKPLFLGAMCCLAWTWAAWAIFMLSSRSGLG